MARSRQFRRPSNRVHLGLTSNELAEAAARGALELGFKRTKPRHLIDLDRFIDPLWACRAQPLERKVSFDQLFWVLPLMTVVPALATTWRREARLFVYPIGVCSTWLPVAMDRTATSPVLAPTRIWIGVRPSARKRSL